MTDNLTPEQRSNLMAGIKGKDSKPEILLRKLLWKSGYRYRLHDTNLPGKPDIVFPSRKKAIFVNGCFWHMHNCNHFKWPETNIDFWKSKILNNVERDEINQKTLSDLGWDVIIVWECEFKRKDLPTLWKKMDNFLK